jgi:hypothetical protein
MKGKPSFFKVQEKVARPMFVTQLQQQSMPWAALFFVLHPLQLQLFF